MKLSEIELAQRHALYLQTIENYGGIRPAARYLDISESTLRARLKAFEVLSELPSDDEEGQSEERELKSYTAPKPTVFRPYKDRPRYFILSAAQDSSKVDPDFFAALLVYAEWLGDCEVMISGFTYSKKLFEDHDKRAESIFFDPMVDPYIIHNRVLIGNDEDGLEFCGEMNTLPTAERPLSGLQTYTRHRWGVFPHTKVQLESVPTMKNKRAKQIMTTGAVTLPNYVWKKAGIKAQFHHVLGAVIVELCPDGSIFARHLLADPNNEGSFYDLDRYIHASGVTEGLPVEALTYGDIHHEKLDPVVAMATWGYDREAQVIRKGNRCLVEQLKPVHEFFHDLSDFAPRNHHNIKDHHFRFTAHYSGPQTDNVKLALKECAQFLEIVRRPRTKQIVVESNHDQALIKWLKTADYRDDPENAMFFLECQLWFYRQLSLGNPAPDIFEHVLTSSGAPEDTIFVNEDSSYTICGNIECGMHGHLGANGARATPGQFVKSGSKSNTGHTHSPTIIDGAYVAGVSATLDMGYNKGLSSWAQAHIVTYPNGKRAILTLCNGKFHANDLNHEEWI